MKQKILIRVAMTDDKTRAKALKTAVQFLGVSAVEIKGDHRNQIEVTGDEVDMICLTNTLRKKVAFAELVSVNKVEPPKDGAKKPEEKKPEEKKPEEKKKRKSKSHVVHHGLMDMVCHLPIPTLVIPTLILGNPYTITNPIFARPCETGFKWKSNEGEIIVYTKECQHVDAF
ncbi:Heavy metal-associated isoprenylated plant protein 16 [Cardamine amara subsp. amara]|uniref:Heavy metal-associated isoprenylated plant protein 16 n=1 Tax=Cardamine amara subsp. amara TaxID=228776 RepID=A0ABD1BG60_CARAN